MKPVICPTLSRVRMSDRVVIVEPTEMAGMVVVPVHGKPCRATTDERNLLNICGLVAGHTGPHWNCSPELVAEDGPWAVVRA